MLKTIAELLTEARDKLRCITSEQALREIGENQGVVIDVRESGEVSDKPTPKSISVPRGVLEMKILQLYPDAETPLYVHCATGARATLAAEQLQRLGYRQVAMISCDLDTVCKTQS